MKILIWIIAAPILAFACWVAVLAVSEAVSPDEYFASSAGLSLRECRQSATTLGMPYDQADAMCSKRVPKKTP